MLQIIRIIFKSYEEANHYSQLEDESCDAERGEVPF